MSALGQRPFARFCRAEPRLATAADVVGQKCSDNNLRRSSRGASGGFLPQRSVVLLEVAAHSWGSDAAVERKNTPRPCSLAAFGNRLMEPGSPLRSRFLGPM